MTRRIRRNTTCPTTQPPEALHERVRRRRRWPPTCPPDCHRQPCTVRVPRRQRPGRRLAYGRTRLRRRRRRPLSGTSPVPDWAERCSFASGPDTRPPHPTSVVSCAVSVTANGDERPAFEALDHLLLVTDRAIIDLGLAARCRSVLTFHRASSSSASGNGRLGPSRGHAASLLRRDGAVPAERRRRYRRSPLWRRTNRQWSRSSIDWTSNACSSCATGPVLRAATAGMSTPSPNPLRRMSAGAAGRLRSRTIDPARRQRRQPTPDPTPGSWLSPLRSRQDCRHPQLTPRRAVSALHSRQAPRQHRGHQPGRNQQ
jgi:hypothetical protein